MQQLLTRTPNPVFKGPRVASLSNLRRRFIFSKVVDRIKHDDEKKASEPEAGTKTPVSDVNEQSTSQSPYYFEAGYAVYAKRPSRPFPPPFLSLPSSSFSDPLSTHNRSKDKRQIYHGEVIRGVTNGDDAVLVSEYLIAANDGVGAWAQKERGHAALWSRLILHFWALNAEKDCYGGKAGPDPKQYLQKAYEDTMEACSDHGEWYGTTTFSGALISSLPGSSPKPVLYVTQLGDSQILVFRPKDGRVIFKTKEQWHWFDCPMQLGTNSPDTPKENAVVDQFEIQEDDVILAMSDGVIDNLWEHEVVATVTQSIKQAEQKYGASPKESTDFAEGMRLVATELVKAAKVIATDPFAESPFMERAIEEGLAMEGGKLDDISVVAAVCKRRREQ